MSRAREPSSTQRRWNYDVFLSFRGEDTRKNFTDHLYHALTGAGINTFRDDNELRRGENITTELLKAINESRISVIVFSRDYAASRWCLEELVKIMECKNDMGQMVLPIFYYVDPTDVRKQTNSYGDAFEKHERFGAEMDKLLKWRAALSEVANLSGWHIQDRHEAKIIKKIKEKILTHLNNTYLHVAKFPVGIVSRVQNMNSRLQVGFKDVRFIGICAMGGMGKTTIAKAIYNQLIHHFECKSFLANVREVSSLPNGYVRLQEMLLADILETKKIYINNVSRGINMIKERLPSKKALIVLDDVDKLEQLNTLAGGSDWFGQGSRIIITTRDQHLLEQIGVNTENIYMVEELDDDESLELFSWHAFRDSHPIENYVELSEGIVSYCKGLPLALEVLGSLLFGKRGAEWKSAMDKLKIIPQNQIQEKLKISFDALEDNEKDIYLDVACFFIGMDKGYVLTILDGCGFFPENGIRVLIDMCLLRIDQYNNLSMHDMLRDMAREIVRREFPKNPEKRSRLWFYDDVLRVLTKRVGTEAVEGLVLNSPPQSDNRFSTTVFANMHRLRLLQLNYADLVGDYDQISGELRWMCWHGFPLKCIPNCLCLKNLVAMDMSYSNMSEVWTGRKVLGKLKVLNLSHSHYLTKTPDFSETPNLEILILEDCVSLVEVHTSIGCLDQLILLDMSDCKSLTKVPESICLLKSLEILNLSGCSTFEKSAEYSSEQEEHHTDGTAIRIVQNFIKKLKNHFKGIIEERSTSRRKAPNSISLLPASIQGLNSLTKLCLRGCNISDGDIPHDIGTLSSLKYLDLAINQFRTLPASITNLSQLEELDVNSCFLLQSLQELPISLRTLNASHCTSLERLSYVSTLDCIWSLVLSKCYSLVEIDGLDKLEYCGFIDVQGCNDLADTTKERLRQVWSRCGFGGEINPYDEIFGSCNRLCGGTSLSFQVPHIKSDYTLAWNSKRWCRSTPFKDPRGGYKMKGFNIYVAYSYDLDRYMGGSFPSSIVTITNKTKALDWTFKITTQESLDHNTLPTWNSYVPQFALDDKLEEGDEVKIVVALCDDEFQVKACGVLFIYDNDVMRLVNRIDSCLTYIPIPVSLNELLKYGKYKPIPLPHTDREFNSWDFRAPELRNNAEFRTTAVSETSDHSNGSSEITIDQLNGLYIDSEMTSDHSNGDAWDDENDIVDYMEGVSKDNSSDLGEKSDASDRLYMDDEKDVLDDKGDVSKGDQAKLMINTIVQNPQMERNLFFNIICCCCNSSL